MSVLDITPCTLGEGPLWHPWRKTLIWFDIPNMRMYENDAGTTRSWQFDECVSAAGWVDGTTLLIASETGLYLFDMVEETRTLMAPLEADNPVTRSNDGRTDPWGSFWIGTMGKSAEAKAGAIYRYHENRVEKVIPDITISNSICFSADRKWMHYSDTVTQQIMRLPLNPTDGAPRGPAEVHIDLRAERWNPDGAIIDGLGNMWVAFWGAGFVGHFSETGKLYRKIALPAKQPTCPAFGGEGLKDLFVTSAAQGQPSDSNSEDGMTFVFPDMSIGADVPRVII